MAGERTFVVKFVSDIFGATKGIKKVGDDLGKLGNDINTGVGSKIKDLMPSFKQMAATATVAFTAVSAAAYKAVQSASNLAESQSKVDVVFGDSAKSVQDFANTAAVSFGITRQAALEASGTYGNLFQAFGVGQGEASTMSTTLVALAADLASFNNTTVDDAILALRSGLSGETEPLKKYGVAINDVRLKEEARNMGLYSGTGALSVTAKTQAAYALILKDSTLAQGDFERTSGGLANQQRILKAQLSDVTAQIGSVMIPAFLGAVSFINQTMIPAFSDFGTALQEGGLAGGFDFIATRFKEAAPKVLDALGEMITKAVEWIGTDGLPMLYAGINNLATSLTGWVEPRIPMFIDSLTKFLMAGYQWIYTKGLPQLLDAVQALGDTLASFVGKAARQLPAQLVDMLATIGAWVLSDGIPALLGMGLRLAGSLVKWTATIAGQLIIGLGGAVVALVAALPDLFVGFVKGLGNIAVGAVQWFVSKFDDMKTALADVAVAVVNTLIDVFNKIPLIPNIDKITVSTKGLGSQVTATAIDLGKVNARFGDVVATTKIVTPAVKAVTTETTKLDTATGGAAKKLKDAATKLKEYTDALKSSNSAHKAFTNAQKASIKAGESLTEANTNLATAQDAFNKAVAGYGADSPEAKKAAKELATAQRDLERAGYNVEGSLFAVADAEAELKKVRADPESSPQMIREAEIALAEAKLSSADAIDSQTEATDSLTKATGLLNDAVFGASVGSEIFKTLSKELTDAKEKQADAVDAVAEAIERETEALEKYAKAIEDAGKIADKYPKVVAANPMAGVADVIPATVTGNSTGFNANGTPIVVNVNAGLISDEATLIYDLNNMFTDFARLNGNQFAGFVGVR
jgi:hypothetical protein